MLDSLPLGRVRRDAATLAVHESDAQTAYRCRATAVVFPETESELSMAIQECAQSGRAFVLRGSGTGLCAGATPVSDGLLIVTSRLDRISRLSSLDRTASVEPGVVNLDISRAGAPHQLFYAPDPSSQPVCSIGGNVGFNAGGAHCLKHGMTSNHVLGLRAVLASGECVDFSSASREYIGPDWTGLFVGNEGLFGAATHIDVNLSPLSDGVFTVLAGFDSADAAGDAVSAIIADGMVPVAMELMDTLTIEAVRPVVPISYPPDCDSLLLIELEGPAAIVNAEKPRLLELLRSANATGLVPAEDDDTRATIWRVRKSAYGAYGRLAPSNMVQDCVVPRRHLGEALRRINLIAEKAGLLCANICHAGDGNIHPNLLHDASQPGAVEHVERTAGQILETCIALGGSITGEHGVGIEKLPYLGRMYGGPEIDLFHRLHRAFDPQGIANPGKMLPPNDWRPASLASPPPTSSPPRLAPTTVTELVDAIRSHDRLVPVGGRTKPALIPGPTCGFDQLDMTGLNGVTDYAPEEFVITARAGTRLSDLQDCLAEQQQCLPFDPLWVDAGSTLGGTVASGLNGPASHLRGAIRDAVLGATFIDGTGQLLTVGAKVVKNVAGFDVTKFLAGSLGRFGVLTEITLKVAPLATAARLYYAPLPARRDLPKTLSRLATHSGQAESVDAIHHQDESGIWIRLTGPEGAMSELEQIFLDEFPQFSRVETFNVGAHNTSIRELTWRHPSGNLVKIPCSLGRLNELLDLLQSIPDARFHISRAGDLIYLSLPASDRNARELLANADFSSLLIRGQGQLRVGGRPAHPVEQRVKAVFDPTNRFPAWPPTN